MRDEVDGKRRSGSYTSTAKFYLAVDAKPPECPVRGDCQGSGDDAALNETLRETKNTRRLESDEVGSE